MTSFTYSDQAMFFGWCVIFVNFVKLLDIKERKALCVRHQDDKAKGIIHVIHHNQPYIVTEPVYSVTVTKSQL